MMNRDELKKYIGITGYSLGQVEKDYLQHILLGEISRHIGGEITFKGGTALQKLGILQRFSEDLDFTAEKPPGMSRLKKIGRNAFFNYDYPAEIDQIIDDERTIGFRIKTEGPLFKGKTSLSYIRIEISKRESVKNVPIMKEIAPPYSDILPYTLSIMDLVEISSEKVRAILTRNKARDLYDLHILITKGTSPNLELVNQKLEYYNTEFKQETFKDRCKQLEKKWDTELTQLLGKPPSYKHAYELVVKKVREMN